MTSGKSNRAQAGALDLDDLPLWLVKRGMRGLPLEEQLAGFCRRVHEAGFPMQRAMMGMGTLHPRYGAHTYLWRPGAGAVESKPRERTVMSRQEYLRSPVHFMRSRGLLALHRRLDRSGEDDFLLFDDLRAQGLTDYAAWIVPYEPVESGAMAREALARDLPPIHGQALEGFGRGQLDRILEALPYLALAVKSRLTYDVACTVVETYLGRDAGHRVLTGAIERGSGETIRAVIWFCDLRGFTRLADILPRDLLIEMLDDYLEAMARPLRDNHGQILKFMGDGLLATFDLTGRDEAVVCEDALKAAAELRSALPVFNAERKAAGKPVMDFGLALHLGEVLYGNIGASDRLDFTVVGPAVNEASRIQALCRSLERDILISSTFRKAAGASGRLKSLGSHALRGVREPQELFTLCP